MLSVLYEMEKYYGTENSALFETELIERFGAEQTIEAIRKGYIEHRWTPCASDKRRCVCYISDKGRQEVEKMLQAEMH